MKKRTVITVAALGAGAALFLSLPRDELSPPAPPTPAPHLVVKEGKPGFALNWEPTSPPYLISLDLPSLKDPEKRVETTIFAPFPSYAWSNLPPGRYVATVIDGEGKVIHEEEFEPIDGVRAVTVQQTSAENLQVSSDLVEWWEFPRGYGYQADPDSIPKLFFRIKTPEQ